MEGHFGQLGLGGEREEGKGLVLLQGNGDREIGQLLELAADLQDPGLDAVPAGHGHLTLRRGKHTGLHVHGHRLPDAPLLLLIMNRPVEDHGGGEHAGAVLAVVGQPERQGVIRLHVGAEFAELSHALGDDVVGLHVVEDLEEVVLGGAYAVDAELSAGIAQVVPGALALPEDGAQLQTALLLQEGRHVVHGVLPILPAHPQEHGLAVPANDAEIDPAEMLAVVRQHPGGGQHVADPLGHGAVVGGQAHIFPVGDITAVVVVQEIVAADAAAEIPLLVNGLDGGFIVDVLVAAQITAGGLVPGIAHGAAVAPHHHGQNVDFLANSSCEIHWCSHSLTVCSLRCNYEFSRII